MAPLLHALYSYGVLGDYKEIMGKSCIVITSAILGTSYQALRETANTKPETPTLACINLVRSGAGRED